MLSAFLFCQRGLFLVALLAQQEETCAGDNAHSSHQGAGITGLGGICQRDLFVENVFTAFAGIGRITQGRILVGELFSIGVGNDNAGTGLADGRGVILGDYAFGSGPAAVNVQTIPGVAPVVLGGQGCLVIDAAVAQQLNGDGLGAILGGITLPLYYEII